ncbi:YfhD family protein [Salipaludibacillus agaradhaerens]|uniref:YfhD family protein n=1 Tax=Salipaludibacillus agaradhaerens TaxID=76935 RepID=A0A9Q4B2V0_SALAG|nr:YfhD family protein [Salipaludibacillus agaradhaerens]MCR6097226.1 YfhD family protein [Salipaludibacillus agaradhaerens]MCR6105952.1 YfhD family protein [Salipaludibacillus agaradhaerens]MCR6113289.1 YfhD family protein [Salipaludibacillus agaradhaerens]MCR6117985.1 YfhD family protein [Salipaludibacillus agaradhaerens]
MDPRKKRREATEDDSNKDVKYSDELADTEDREAQARAKAATQRVNKNNI